MAAKQSSWALGFGALLALQACETSLPLVQTKNDKPAPKAEENPGLKVFGQPAEVWTGGDCNLGALEMAAYDGLTGQQLNGVLVNLKGSQFDGQLLETQLVRLPSGFSSGIQTNSQPRSYDVTVDLPPGYVRAEPERAVVHYDCKSRKSHFVEFNLFRTLEDAPSVEAF